MKSRARDSACAAALAILLGMRLATAALAAPGGADTLARTAVAAPQVHVSGRVVDRAGKPIEYATVAAKALRRGAATDEQGRFALDLPAGRVTLDVSQLGYEASRVEVQVADGLAPLRVVLGDQPVPLSEVTVAASSFGKTGKSEGAVVSRRDVVMTPGGAADVFQALRALPGINAPDEGAAVVVRGGPPDETLIRLDGTDIGHPYHYEHASGGLFSNLDSFMLKSAFFSSGGFSSKYGGVLSGVLDIETQDPMHQKAVSVGLGMAGFGVSTSYALIPDRLALVGTARMSITSILFKLYGSSSEYESAPSSADGMAKLIGRYSQTGRVSVMFLDAGDRVSVFSDQLGYHGLYHESARSRFGALALQDVIAGKIAVRGELGGQVWDSRWTYGPVISSEAERNGQASLDLVWPVSPRHELSFGLSERARHSEITGTFPDDSTDFAPGAPVRTRETRPSVSRPGFYLEDKLRLWGPFYATLGGRVDYASTPGTWTTDPRGALAWRLDDHQTLRIALGRYHQLAAATYLDPRYGNPELEPLEADHAIAGYEWSSPQANLRVEGYSKTYRNLILNDSLTFYSNRGHGYARGVDVFVQGTHDRTTGWISYGYLDTRRQELDDPRELPARYDVRHTITAVIEYAVSNVWHTGARYSFNSGHPWTPVVDRTWDPARGLWHPVFGENSSAWFPAYHRLDLRLTRLFTLPGGFGIKPSNVCAFYVEGMNVLGIENLLEYNYTSDYSQKIPRDSYFSRRLLVAGVGMTW